MGRQRRSSWFASLSPRFIQLLVRGTLLLVLLSQSGLARPGGGSSRSKPICSPFAF